MLGLFLLCIGVPNPDLRAAGREYVAARAIADLMLEFAELLGFGFGLGRWSEYASLSEGPTKQF